MVDASFMPLMAALVAATAIAALVYVVTYPYISGDRERDKRFESVTESRSKKLSTRSAADIAATRKKQVSDTLKDIETRQKAKEKVTLRLRLMRAGLDAEPKAYWLASAASGAVTAVLAFGFLPNSSLIGIEVAVAAFVGTFGLPRFMLSKMIARRQKKFLAELANSIDVIVRGIKSGLPLNECLSVIASESPEPIAGEFKEVIDQQRVGVPLSEALDRLTIRVPLAEVKFLAIVIAIQQQSGGNLAEALSNLSGVLRDRLKMAMKVKALSAEAKSSALVLASLPPGVMIMVYMSAPDYIRPLFATKTGNLTIFAGLFWMGLGVVVMRKMINFKF
jgi:tight adherence protein B